MIDREEFENLNAEEQARVFRESSIREKGELFLRCHEPDRIAHSLTGEEFYLIIKETDLEEKIEILRFATLPQIFFLSDIECWRGDRLSPAGFVGWLETLREADEKKLLAWLLYIDYEIVVAGLKQVIQVLKPEWEYAADETLGDDASFTLDQYYYICVKEESFETIRRALAVLFENHRGRYTALMEGVLGELDYEVEEEAFRKRGQRLEEHGFPDPQTARQIFHPISNEEFENFPRKNAEKIHGSTRKSGEPRFSLIPFTGKENLFLDDVLRAVREGDPALETAGFKDREVLSSDRTGGDPVVAEGVEEELVWLSNKVIAAEGIDFVAEEKVRQGVERIRRLLSFGLELVSGRDIQTAARFARERWLELIFRLAVTRLYEIRSAAESITEKYWRGQPRRLLEFLNPPYEIIFREIFLPVPQFFDDSITENHQQSRDFKSLADAGRTMRAIDQIAFIHKFLARKVPQIFEEFDREKNAGSPWSLFGVLATLYASFVLSGGISARALSEDQVLRFTKEGFETKNGERVLDARKKKAFADQFFSGEEQELSRTLWALVFGEIESELGRLKISKKFDPRFVSVLRIHRSIRGVV